MFKLRFIAELSYHNQKYKIGVYGITLNSYCNYAQNRIKNIIQRNENTTHDTFTFKNVLYFTKTVSKHNEVTVLLSNLNNLTYFGVMVPFIFSKMAKRDHNCNLADKNMINLNLNKNLFTDSIRMIYSLFDAQLHQEYEINKNIEH